MSFHLTDCKILDVLQHPFLTGRVTARVAVALHERRNGEDADHRLTLKVWADTTDSMTPEQVRTAVLKRVATVLSRTIAVADIDHLSIAAE